MANSDSSKRKKAGSRAGGPRKQSKTGPRNAGGQATTGSAQADKPGQDAMAAALLNLSKLYGEGGQGAASGLVTDALSQAVLLLLGTGPAVAAYEGLLSAQNSNGVMFHQAVSNQQRMNLLGMCTTAKCVRYMFDGDDEDFMDVEEILDDAGKG